MTAGRIDWRVITACGSCALGARLWVVKKATEQPLVCDLQLAFSLATLTQTKHRLANKKSRKVCFTFTPSTNYISCYWDSTFLTWSFRSVSKINRSSLAAAFCRSNLSRKLFTSYFSGRFLKSKAPVGIILFWRRGFQPTYHRNQVLFLLSCFKHGFSGLSA